MPGLFDKLKSGAESARFEAEKMVRLQQAQSALNKLQHDLETQMAAIGQQAVALYDAGGLTQPELVAPCQQLGTLRQQIADQQAQVERIKADKGLVAGEPVGPPPAVSVPPVRVGAPAAAPAGRTCPQCGTPIGADTRFCPNCGASTVPAQPATMPCPSCGNTVAADAAFCPECGARLRASGPAA